MAATAAAAAGAVAARDSAGLVIYIQGIFLVGRQSSGADDFVVGSFVCFISLIDRPSNLDFNRDSGLRQSEYRRKARGCVRGRFMPVQGG